MTVKDTARWFCPHLLFDGQQLVENMALQIRGAQVAAMCQANALPADTLVTNLPGIVSPGYLDLQVNGGGNVLLNDVPTAAAMGQIAAAHRRFGTVGILPTVITDSADVLAATVEAALEAPGQEGILGLHIEGPHISLARRGTHAARHVRPMDETTQTHVERLRAAGIMVMITLAPEAATPAQITRLAATGAVVSIGHSDADAEAVQASFEAGARCVTHLYNAMSPMQNRAPGVTGAAINSRAYAGIICDGVHVADDMVALAIRARPVAERMFLVSDAMPTVGGNDSFMLYGETVTLRDGQLVNAEGSLAGAHVTMAQSVQRLVQVLGIAPDQALKMAVSVPAALIGRADLMQLQGRLVRDLLYLDAELEVLTSPF
ncbi:MAG: N-acetylglucosamine-6-phosphate deacetylase [Rhodobacteraceae bacterium]|nr:N-acetylglucosamine-6-phosphate deacetylase [Paracoccaceae bacterium]